MKEQRILVIGGVGLMIFCIAMPISLYGIWGLIKKLLIGISVLIIAVAFILKIISILSLLCNDKVKEKERFKKIGTILFLGVMTGIGLFISPVRIYNASLDLINRELITVNIHNLEFEIESGTRTPNTYHIKGNNNNGIDMEFAVEKKTYKTLKEKCLNKSETLEITYYKESEVIDKIE